MAQRTMQSTLPHWMWEGYYHLRDFLDLFAYERPFKNVDSHHPLFYVGVRQAKWVETPVQLLRFNQRVLRWTSIITLLLIVSLLVLPIPKEVTFNALLVITGASILAGIAVDFLCALYGANSIWSVFRGDMADLLRVSNIDLETIVQTRYQLARIFAWRAFFIHAVTRMGLVALWATLSIIEITDRFATVTPLHDKMMFTGLILGLNVGLAGFLISEPYWRYTAMTRLGVLQAVRYEHIYRVWAQIGMNALKFYLWQIAYVMGWVVMFFAAQSLIGIEVAINHILPDTVLLPFMFGLLAALIPALYLLVIRHSQLRFVTDRQLNNVPRRFFGRVE